MSHPVSLDPASADSPTLAARKSNQLLFNTYSANLGPPPYPGGLTSLAPARNDSLALSLKKINAILSLQSASSNFVSHAEFSAAINSLDSRISAIEKP